METFKVGDKVVWIEGPGDFVRGKAYDVAYYGLSLPSVMDSNGQAWWSYRGTNAFALATPSAPPEDDKALAWLKAKVTKRSAINFTTPWNDGFDEALKEMLEAVYGLEVETVPQTLAFVPVT